MIVANLVSVSSHLPPNYVPRIKDLVIVYTEHKALKPIFVFGQTEKRRIATWLDRLGEFDIKLVHRPSRNQQEQQTASVDMVGERC